MRIVDLRDHVAGIEPLPDKEMVFQLRATATAIKEGTTNVQETFFPKPSSVDVKEEVKVSDDLFKESNDAESNTNKKGGSK